jgi:hypothetical protein
LAAVALAASGGCGGDSGGQAPGKAARTAVPRPRLSAARASRELARAMASGDCRALFDVALHSTKRNADLSRRHAPPSREECANLAAFARNYRGFRADGPTRVFGTAAVTDGHVRATPVEAVLVLDLDGTWKSAVLSGSYPQAGSRAPAGNAFDANVARFVRAARADDCNEVFRLLALDSEVHTRTGGTRGPLCASLRKRPRDPRSFFTRLKADPAARPFPLGKTAEFAFYGLALKTGVYYTLFATRQPDRVRVTPAHVRDAVYNWYLARE